MDTPLLQIHPASRSFAGTRRIDRWHCLRSPTGCLQSILEASGNRRGIGADSQLGANQGRLASGVPLTAAQEQTSPVFRVGDKSG
jgi:hypothetical protein